MSDLRVLHSETCASLSNRSTLTFQLGRRDSEFIFRIVGNTARGCFAAEWVTWTSALALLQSTTPLNATALHPLFAGKSINTSGFLMAVLLHVGAIKASPNQRQGYELADLSDWMARMGALMSSHNSLGESLRPTGFRRGRRAASPDVNAATLDS